MVAIQSYSGGYTTDTVRIQGGRIFIDIYETGSGKRVCGISGTHQEYDGSMFLSRTFWVGNRELVVGHDPLWNHQLLYCNFASKR